jgi:hypothetical protein
MGHGWIWPGKVVAAVGGRPDYMAIKVIKTYMGVFGSKAGHGAESRTSRVVWKVRLEKEEQSFVG